MISLKQKELNKWQEHNFGGNVPSDKLALGMAEEVGELCHCLLKRAQVIREGYNQDKLKEEIADAFADAVIYGIQLLTNEGLDAEQELAFVIENVLLRDWRKFPKDGETE